MSLWTTIKHVSAWVALGAITLASQTAFAQAWVGERNSLGLSLDYNIGLSNKIVNEFELRNQVPDNEFITNHNVALGIEYIPLDKLGLAATVPLVAAKYGGNGELFPPHGRYDDGNYHTTLQDFRLTGRYMVLGPEAVVAASPHIGFSVPMTDYEDIGYAGAGRGLKQLHLGASVGKYFTSGVPDLYVHANYEFSLVEAYETAFQETADIGQNRSDFKLLVGYFITEKLEVNAGTDLRIPHGGLEFVDFDDVGQVVRNHHDALLAERFLLLGGGVSYQALSNLRVNAIFRLWMWGENTRDTNVFGGGVSWDVM